MKRILPLLSILLSCSLIYSQSISDFTLSNAGGNTLGIAVTLDADNPGSPVLVGNNQTSIFVFVPGDLTISSTMDGPGGGSWSANQALDAATIAGFCPPGNLGELGYNLINISNLADVNLGPVVGFVPVDVASITFSGVSSEFLTGYDPSGADLTSACLSVFANNTGTIEGLPAQEDIPVLPSVILPIELISFTAQKNDKNSIILDWTSSAEVNSSHFEIQRSIDGENFETIGSVDAAGNSLTDKHYSFIDRDINVRRNQTRIYYYRLNMVDLDAYQEYSEIKAVRMTNDGYANVFIFPNPTAELLNIDVSSDLEDGNIKYEITDIEGRRLITESIDVSVQQIHTVNLKSRGLQSGVYMLRLFNNQEILSLQKVVLVSH